MMLTFSAPQNRWAGLLCRVGGAIWGEWVGLLWKSGLDCFGKVGGAMSEGLQANCLALSAMAALLGVMKLVTS